MLTYCRLYQKDKINEKEAGNGPFLQEWLQSLFDDDLLRPNGEHDQDKRWHQSQREDDDERLADASSKQYFMLYFVDLNFAP